jgi:hypothetical protein
MGRVLKIGLLTLPLIAAAWFFGMVCRRLEAGHLLLALTLRDLLPLLRDLVLALAALALTSGIAALLFQPLWIAGVAFALSGLALLLGWGVTMPHALLTLLFVLAGLGHSALTQRDLSQRTHFSVASAALSQLGLLVVLAAIAAGALYMGAAGYIREQGFSIPEQYSSEFAERLASRAAAPFPSLIQEQVYNTVRSYAEQLLTEELKQLMKPVSPYVPVAAALALFLPLLAVCCVLALLALPVLWLLLVLLKAVGVTRVSTQTIEAERLALS